MIRIQPVRLSDTLNPAFSRSVSASVKAVKRFLEPLLERDRSPRIKTEQLYLDLTGFDFRDKTALEKPRK